MRLNPSRQMKGSNVGQLERVEEGLEMEEKKGLEEELLQYVKEEEEKLEQYRYVYEEDNKIK